MREWKSFLWYSLRHVFARCAELNATGLGSLHVEDLKKTEADSNAASIALLLNRLSRPLCFADIGARWGPSSVWHSIGNKARIICFEPDSKECSRLTANRRENETFLPFALGAREGEVDLVITREPSCSSVYPPIRVLYSEYPGLEITEPIHRVRVPCRTLDGVGTELSIPVFDAIKLDTQGSELDILRGAKKILKNCSLLTLRWSSTPFMKGKTYFAMLIDFCEMRDLYSGAFRN